MSADFSSPTASSISPANNSGVNSSSVNFSALFQDNIDLRNVTLSIYNSSGLVNSTSSALSGTSNFYSFLVGLLDGIYTWFFQVYDTATNSLLTANYTLIVDTLFPQISFVLPTLPTNSIVNATNIEVNVSSSDLNHHFVVTNFDNSLVSWWRMDDTNSTGTLVQDYMNRNNGTAVNGASQVSNGKFGKAWSFDGTDDRINLTEVIDLNNKTFSIWVKEVGGSYAGLLCFNEPENHDTRSYIQLDYVNGRVVIKDDIGGGGSVYSLPASDYEWHLWTFVTNSYNMSVYYDTSNIFNKSLSSSLSIRYIGKGYYNSFFNGSIDDVMIFNRS